MDCYGIFPASLLRYVEIFPGPAGRLPWRQQPGRRLWFRRHWHRATFVTHNEGMTWNDLCFPRPILLTLYHLVSFLQSRRRTLNWERFMTPISLPPDQPFLVPWTLPVEVLPAAISTTVGSRLDLSRQLVELPRIVWWCNMCNVVKSWTSSIWRFWRWEKEVGVEKLGILRSPRC